MKWSRGKIELELSLEEARKGSHIGQCQDDLRELRAVPGIRAQLEALDPDVVREALGGLASHDHEKT